MGLNLLNTTSSFWNTLCKFFHLVLTFIFSLFFHRRRVHGIVYNSKSHLKSWQIAVWMKSNDFLMNLWWFDTDWCSLRCSKWIDKGEPLTIKCAIHWRKIDLHQMINEEELKLLTLGYHPHINMIMSCTKRQHFCEVSLNSFRAHKSKQQLAHLVKTFQ